MSGTARRGEGEAEFAIYFSRKSRKPFLQRNVRKVWRALIMGSTFSAFAPSAPSRSRNEVRPSEDEEDEEPRPMKRRRLNQENSNNGISRPGPRSPRISLDHVTSQMNRASISSSVEAVKPPDFYGRPHQPTLDPLDSSTEQRTAANGGKHPLDRLLPQKPVHFMKGLRLDILGITPSSGSKKKHPNAAARSIDIKCKASVAILHKDEDALAGEDPFTQICQLPLPGTLRISFAKNDEVLGREFIFPEPFIFKRENLYINRKPQKSNHQLGSNDASERTYTLADEYKMRISVELRGHHPDWPGLDIPSLEEIGYSEDGESLGPNSISLGLEARRFKKSQLKLYCETSSFFDPEQQLAPLPLQVCFPNPNNKQEVEYFLHINLVWTSPNLASTWIKSERIPKMLEAESLEEPTDISDSATTTPRKMRGSPTKENPEDAAPASPAADGRPQRRRANVATYNLKRLMNIQEGRSPRKEWGRDQAGNSVNDKTTVTYSFGRADAAEVGIKQKTTVHGLICALCEVRSHSVNELRLHLQHEHSSYFKFHLRRENPPQFFVEIVKHRSNPGTFKGLSRTLQLSRPKTLFDVEKYLSGNESWIKARYGPHHNLLPQHLDDRAFDSSVSPSPYASRQSSPNTSNDPEDFEQYEPKQQLPTKPRRVFYVPKTSKPLYDTITKRVLEPGEEIPDSDEEFDYSWLHPVYRNILNEFSDVTDDEKEYIHQWNRFIVDEKLSCTKYLPDSILRFVEASKFWLVEVPFRKSEFMKQLEVFVMRGDADERCLHKSMGILRRAEAELAAKGKDKEKEDVPMGGVEVGKRRGMFDCICGVPIPESDRIICKGDPKLMCPGRFFHRICAQKYGRPVVGPDGGDWKCAHCYH